MNCRLVEREVSNRSKDLTQRLPEQESQSLDEESTRGVVLRAGVVLVCVAFEDAII